MPLVNLITKEMVREWKPCPEYTGTNSNILDTVYGPHGLTVSQVYNFPGVSADDKAWTLYRYDVLGDKVWEATADLLDGIGGVMQTSSIVATEAVRSASTGVFLTYEAARTSRRDVRSSFPGGIVTRQNILLFAPMRAVTALEEHLRTDRDSINQLLRRSKAIQSVLHSIADQAVHPEPVFQGVLDTILQYYVDAGLA